MVAIHPKADIFFSDKRKIYIFLAGKIIEIEDTDDCLASSFLRWLYVKSYGNLDDFINETRDISEVDELNEAIDSLVKIGVLIEPATFSTQQGRFVVPFIPFNFCRDIWGARNGQKFFFFVVPNQLEAVRMVKEMALSWIDEVEAGIVAGLLEGKVECLPAKISVLEVKSIRISGDCILAYDSANKKSKIYKKKFPKRTKSFDFWRELIKRAVGEIGIVPIVKKILDKEGPFRLSVHTFLSCHKLSSLRDKSDDWQIGRDQVLERAKGKSTMEAIERYCGRKKLSKKNLVFSSMKRLGVRNCLSPLEIATYSKFQFEKGWLKGIVEFNKNLKTNWVRVKNFRKNEFKFIPECFVSFPEVTSHSEKNPQFFFANSSGMAGHTGLDQAIENGVLEIIERDTILIHWINRISPNKIAFLDKHSDYLLSVKEKLKLLGYQLAVLDLTLDTVPVIMSVAYKENGDSGFFSGAAAAKSKMEAISRSIKELEFTVWARIGNLPGLKKEIEDIKIKTIWKPSHHETIYLKPDISRHLEFLYRGKEVKFSESDLNTETEIFAATENTGRKIYYVDLTSEDVRDLELGIRVVRCIVPGFVPITFGYGYEPLGMKRIYNVPLKMGITSKPLCERDAVENYLPHFFP